jgi:hypothetical protein
VLILLVGIFNFIDAGPSWAAYVGVFFAVLDAIGQLLYLPSCPLWSVVIIAIDVIVICGLATASPCTAPRRRRPDGSLVRPRVTGTSPQVHLGFPRARRPRR